MSTSTGILSDTTLRNMQVAWAIWSEVGDLDHYPDTEEMQVVSQLASEVNGVHFRKTMDEMVRRMADNYYYPYEDVVAQQRAYMFEPGSWADLSYVDKMAVVERLLDLPHQARFGLTLDDSSGSNKDTSDRRAMNYQNMSETEQSVIVKLVNRVEKAR